MERARELDFFGVTAVRNALTRLKSPLKIYAGMDLPKPQDTDIDTLITSNSVDFETVVSYAESLLSDEDFWIAFNTQAAAAKAPHKTVDNLRSELEAAVQEVIIN